MAVQRARWVATAALMLALVGIGPRVSGLPPDQPPPRLRRSADQPPLKLRRSAGALAKAEALRAKAEGGSHVDLFDELYRRGHKQNGDMRTLTAAFTETTTSSLLTRPLTARGTVAVERPGRVALRYTEPDDRVVIIDGDRMTLSWPSRGVRQTKDVGASQRRVQKYFVNSSPDELRGHFQVTAREADDRPGYLITLVPKRKQIREGLSRLELWIEPETLLMSAMRMWFPNGDSKLMTYTDVKPNAPIDGLFKEKE